ncbi:hypothetical protein BC827DRAFT_1194928 [Russula dissimulans]|nr:hypothetical protein BC827DRAFT_1194928 [Russula dissimulans]
MQIFIFFLPWGWQQPRALAIKGKTPGSKPRDLSFSGPFSASCVLEGYECQSSSNSSELPGCLDTSLPALSTSTVVQSRSIYYLRSHFFPTHFDTGPPRLVCVACVVSTRG